MYTVDQNYLRLADFLRQNKEMLDIQSEVSQIDGAISCANSSRMCVAICGKTDSCFDYLFKLITDNHMEWNDILWTVPFKLVYGQTFSIKYLANGEVRDTGNFYNIPEEQCEFIEISADLSLLRTMDLLFLTLLEGNERNTFDERLSACDYVVLCPNFSNAIGIEYHTLCRLIRNEWQQPERVRAIAIDINNLSLPGTMMRALSENLGAEGVIPYIVIDDLKDFSGNQKNMFPLLDFENDKENILARTYTSVDSACKKSEICLQKYLSEKESLKNEIEDFSDRINAFKAQAVIHIPGLSLILDESMKSDIFHKTAGYIGFVQGKIKEEIYSLSKEEIEAYVPAYYSSLISEFVKQLCNSELLPVVQNKFDKVIGEILECYKQFFHTNVPEELYEKTRIASKNFFSLVDKTAVDKTDIGIGIIESAVVYVLVYDNPLMVLCADEIVQLVHEIKKGLIDIYNAHIRSTESYAKEVANRVNEVLDENLKSIPKQIEDVLLPTLEKNMQKVLESFVEEAAEPVEAQLEKKKAVLADIQKTIENIKNMKNNLDGLLSKCN